MRILVIEDSVKINHMLTTFLKQLGYQVFQAYSGEEGVELFAKYSFDLVLTDLMLPNMQGEDLIRWIKRQSNCYIIAISAKSTLEDRLDVLHLGADDFIIKPFSIEEVLAKCQNIEKRVIAEEERVVSFNQGLFCIYPKQRKVMVGQQEVNLTKHEFNILWQLAKHRNSIHSREQLLDSCFEEPDAFDRVIDVHIKNIRKKLNVSPQMNGWIKTEYGVGYQFIGTFDD